MQYNKCNNVLHSSILLLFLLFRFCDLRKQLCLHSEWRTPWGPTAGEEEPSGWQDVNTPDYLKEVTDGQFVNISIRGYEKNSSSGFPREDYYAFHVVSMYGMFSMWKY